MSADTQELIQQSLQGDQRAFGQIVERYQGAVSAMAYSVTGNLAQSEDLAQEAFIIAWKKLGALQKHESLSAWLCGIARNLARDWMRTQAARPTVSMEHLEKSAEPLESPDATQRQRERADLVWTALAEIPEIYREPLVLFYRQGESIRDIAEALELSEDNVKQRLSRGRKLLRAEVARTVEDTLADTRPGKAFTAGVLAALPALYCAKTNAAEMATTSAKAVAAPAAIGALMKIALPVAVVALVTIGGAWWDLGFGNPDSNEVPSSLVANKAADKLNEGVSDGEATLKGTIATPLSSATITSQVGAAMADKSSGTITGIVVIRGTDEPALGMRVVYGRRDSGLTETLTDEAGRFTFEGVPVGEYAVLAYDAGYDEMPEDAYRSEHHLATVTAGKTTPELRIEVPPIGEVLTGRITDAKTGEPLSELKVRAFRFGGGSFEGTSDNDGHYQVRGLSSGTWLVQVDQSNSAIIIPDHLKDMENVVVKSGKPATLDLALDRGVPLVGIAVDEKGHPVPDANISAKLFPPGGVEFSCNFTADSAGKFLFWGSRPGDTVVVRANKDKLSSHINIVKPTVDLETENIVLALLPTVSVSGRFVDEEGRPVAATLWSQPINPEGIQNWSGQLDRETTFASDFSQGTHEVKGLAKGIVLSTHEISQVLEVGPEPIKDLVIKVTTKNPNAGSYTLSGRVVDEQGKPLVRCRLYIRGDSRDTLQFGSLETHTNDTGQFQFKGLADGSYTVHAVPGIEPYEQVSGYEKLNPVETPEITIVARRAPSLRGRVVDAASGEPIPSFTVECGELHADDYEDRWGPESPNIHADSGEFSIPARLDMNWYLRVSAPGYAPQRLNGVALESGEVSAVMEFKLSPGRTASGTVVDSEGTPVARAKIYLRKGFVDGPTATGDPVTETDSGGRFEISSIAEGEEYVYAWQKGFAFVREAIGEDIRLVLHQGGTIEGHVTANGVVPSDGYSLFATIPDTNFGTSAAIEADGSYRFDGLMEIGYRIQVTFEEEGKPNKYYSTGELVEVKRDQITTHDIDFPIGTGVVAGVARENGAPVTGLDISCRNNGVCTYASTDENGAYRFEGLSPGTVKLSIPATTTSRSQSYREIAALEIEADQVIQHDIELPQN